MTILRVYDKLIDLVAAVTRPDNLLGFRLSTHARGRMQELIAREQQHGLGPAETLELELYLDLAYAFARLRARARRQHLARVAHAGEERPRRVAAWERPR